MTANFGKQSQRTWRAQALTRKPGPLHRALENWTCLQVVGVLAVLHAIILALFQREVPGVYMDEIFHERQTRTYCQGHFRDWDPKITTPPGLYMIGAAVLKVIETLQSLFLSTTTSKTPASSSLCAIASTASASSTLPYLRPINILFNLGSFILLHAIFHKVQRLSNGEALAQALGLLLYPVLFFFGFLYYTDAGSLFCVLAMYYLARVEKHVPAAFMGGVSLLFRQTNIAWIAFILGSSIIVEDLQQAVVKKDYYYRPSSLPPTPTHTNTHTPANGTTTSTNGHHATTTSTTTTTTITHTPAEYIYNTGSFSLPKTGPTARQRLPDPAEPLSFSLLFRFILYLFTASPRLLCRFWPYLVPIVGFVYFLVWNGGQVVLGDAQMHTPTVHVAQLAYSLLLTAVIHRPLLFVPFYYEPEEGDKESALAGFWYWLSGGKKQTQLNGRARGVGESSSSSSNNKSSGLVLRLFFLTLAGLVLHRFTLSHPFLLSDNRHYTFYIWKRLFQRSPTQAHTHTPWATLGLLPVYAVCVWWVATRVYIGSGASRRSSSLTALILGVASAMVLLPAHLIEPRYFTLPVVVALLEMPPRSHLALVLSMCVFVCVNVGTVFVFLYRPFVWGDGSVARFMW